MYLYKNLYISVTITILQIALKYTFLSSFKIFFFLSTVYYEYIFNKDHDKLVSIYSHSVFIPEHITTLTIKPLTACILHTICVFQADWQGLMAIASFCLHLR